MTSSIRSNFQLRRRPVLPVNNSVRRVYHLIRSSLLGRDGLVRLVEEDVMGSLSASRASVRGALQRLAGEGLVQRSPRHGTTAVPFTVLPIGAVMALADDHLVFGLTFRCIEARVMSAPTVLRTRLDLDVDSPVALIEALLVHGDEPVALLTSYVGLPHGTGTELVTGDPMALLASCLQGRVGEGETMVGACGADAETATLLSVPPDTPVLWCEDVVRDLGGRPRAICQWSLRSDRAVLSSAIQRLPA